MTTTETSLSLAEDYVRETIKREVYEQRLNRGEKIEVAGIDQCDCVPVNVAFDEAHRRGNWLLEGVRVHGYGKLAATYKWEPANASH